MECEGREGQIVQHGTQDGRDESNRTKRNMEKERFRNTRMAMKRRMEEREMMKEVRE